jgi:aspartyl-tRNA(Asn)/glutamyl-tRNA(Gln) amidotransferase subunit A
MKRIPARERLELALARIDDPQGEGRRACLTIYRDAAGAAADAADARTRNHVSLGPLDGTIVTIKDLFDVAGEVTRAGSKVLAREGRPAAHDAAVVQRLRAAGAVIIAKTNMTEFAFSGVGANPHFGTPGNPADRARIPGGSSSGGAVAMADGMCEIAIGSDTGGSTRIPAALCGIVGFKPSRQRIPTTGAFPLSHSLDSIGPMAKSVMACAEADAVMAGEEPHPFEPAPLGGLRLGVMQGMVLEKLDATVSKRFSAALTALEKAGARLSNEKLAPYDEMAKINALGGIVPAEAYAVHRERLARHHDEIDPMIAVRLVRAEKIAAADYQRMVAERVRLIKMMDAQLADLDALLLPTTPIVAPLLSDLETSDGWGLQNALLLRNTSIGNFFDLTAISVPMPGEIGLPAGLMLMARNGHDTRLMRIAAAVERLFAA